MKATMPTSAGAGEPLYTMDTKELFIGNGDEQPLSPIGAKVGSSGTQDYLNESYFEQDSTNHIRIKQNTMLSGVDADMLDGNHASAFSLATHNHSGVYEPVLTKGDIEETTSSVLTVTGGTDAVIGSGVTIEVKQASDTQSGYLSSTDWSTFDGKQDALGYTPEDSANKGAVSGYAGLDSSGKLAQNVDASKITSGTIDIARLPAGALERLIIVADQTARYALLPENAQNGDTVKQTDTGVMYYVKDDTNLDNANGYEVYAAGTAASVAWSGVSGKPTTLSGYGITDGVNTSDVVTTATANKILKLDSNAKLPASITGDADTVDGKHANDFALVDHNHSGVYEPVLTKGNLSESTSSVLTITGGTSSVIGSGTTIQVKQASDSQAGYLSSTDWTTFNSKLDTSSYTAADILAKLKTVDGSGSGLDADLLDGYNYSDFTMNFHGFPDRAQTTLALSGAEKDTLTISPTGSTFQYYYLGTMVTVTGSKNITLTDLGGGTHANGIHYIYFDDVTATLRVSTSPWNLEAVVPVAIVIWNQSNTSGARSLLGDERHTTKYTPLLHKYLHLTHGAQKISGGSITGYTIATATDAATTYGLSSMVIADEDIFLTLSALTDGNGSGANNTIFYHTATGVWGWKQGNNFSFIPGAAGRLQYDSPSAGFIECTNNRYINSYIVATNFSGEAAFATVWSQAEHSAITDAYAESISNLDFTGFPIQEFVPMYQLTWATNNSYVNTGKCRIERVIPISVTAAQITNTLTSNDHSALINRDAIGAHPAIAITTDTTHRFVTDTQISNWDAKLDASSYTATDVLTKIKTVDGSGSGLDADTLDSCHVNDSGTTTSDLWTASKIQAAINAVIGANDAMVYKGVLDCSGDPNYPAADAGHTYKVSVAGKIGGASGVNVEIGDLLLCCVDGTASGTQAVVGSNWDVVQVNIDGAVTSSSTSSTDNTIARFDLVSGKIIQNSLVTIDDGGSINIPSGQKYKIDGSNLSATDVGAEPTLTKGNLTETTSSVLTITGGTSSIIGSGIAIQVKQASSSQAGYLSSTDWTTFNNKQATLGYTPEDAANKNVASGYCPLDASILVPLANIPTTLTGKNADKVDSCDVNDSGTTTADLWTASKIMSYIGALKFRTF